MMNTGPENIRRLKTKLNNSKKTLSSRRWLERQINDPFVLAASEKNYRSRSAFKLLELNKKFRLFKKGDHVLDLGSYPGGWSQVSVNAVWGPLHGKVVAIDFKEMQPIKGVNFIRADINDEKLTLLIKKEFNYVCDHPFKHDVQKRSPNVTKAKKILGFEAKTSLDESLNKIIPWVTNQVHKGLI